MLFEGVNRVETRDKSICHCPNRVPELGGTNVSLDVPCLLALDTVSR